MDSTPPVPPIVFSVLHILMHLMSSRCQTIVVCPLLSRNSTLLTFSFCGSDVFSPVLTQITFSRLISLCGFLYGTFPFVFFLPHCHTVMLQNSSSRFSSPRIPKDKIPFYVLFFFVIQYPSLKTSFLPIAIHLSIWSFCTEYIYFFLIVGLGALERTDIVSAYLSVMPLALHSSGRRLKKHPVYCGGIRAFKEQLQEDTAVVRIM